MLSELCSLINQSLNLTTPSYITFTRAWKKVGLPGPAPSTCPSMILVRVLQYIPQASDEFALSAVQVLVQCLLHSVEPLSLAALIVDAEGSQVGFDNSLKSTKTFRFLLDYALSLVDFTRYTALERTILATNLLKSCFAKDSIILDAMSTSPSMMKKSVSVSLSESHSLIDDALPRQLSHLVLISNESSRGRILKYLRIILPIKISVWQFV